MNVESGEGREPGPEPISAHKYSNLIKIIRISPSEGQRKGQLRRRPDPLNPVISDMMSGNMGRFGLPPLCDGGGSGRRIELGRRGPPAVTYYPDRKWQGISAGMTYTFTKDGAPQIDARDNVYYVAAGNSPAMMDKNIGQGSQYLWTYRDAAGEYLDGAKTYKLHVLPNIPAKAFLVSCRLRQPQPIRATRRAAAPVR
jgi:hypothetical protein